MPYLPLHALSADETSGSPAVMDILQKIRASQEDAERWRKWQAIFAAAGSLFAAAKLGIITLPKIKAMRGRPLGTLVGNPRRRRRR